MEIRRSKPRTLRDNIEGTSIRRLVNSQHEFWGEKKKATDPRIRILDLLKSESEPLTAVEILQRLPEIHLATIYRTLKILLEADIIRKVHGLNRKKTLFELRPVERRKKLR